MHKTEGEGHRQGVTSRSDPGILCFSYCCRTASTSRRTPRFASRGRASNGKLIMTTRIAVQHFTGRNACSVAYYCLTPTEVPYCTGGRLETSRASWVSFRPDRRSRSAGARSPGPIHLGRCTEGGGERGRSHIGDDEDDGAVRSGVSLSLSVGTLDSSEFTPSTDAIVRHRRLKFVTTTPSSVAELVTAA